LLVSFFLRATFLSSLLSVSPSSSVVCHAFSLSVLVLLLLPAAHHYIHYANHCGLIALKVMTVLFIDKIRYIFFSGICLHCDPYTTHTRTPDHMMPYIDYVQPDLH
jgi:hypothetical protein